MEKSDLADVSAISDAVHASYSEPLAVYAERLSLFPAGCFLLEQNGQATGYLITHPWYSLSPVPLRSLLGEIPSDTGCYYLHDIALMPQARGTGAGVAGAELAMECARKNGAREMSLVAVNGADRFWTKQGFAHLTDAAILGRTVASYGPDVFFMVRPVSEMKEGATG